MAYEQTTDLSFSQALELVKLGKKVCRVGWPLMGTYICYMLDYKLIDGTIGLKRCSWPIELGWQPTCNDMLSNDWYLIQ